MKHAHLYLGVRLIINNPDWYKTVETTLNNLKGADNLQIVKAEREDHAQISLNYSLEKVSLNSIEKIIKESGAEITEISIGLESAMTGSADPYSASSIALPVKEELIKIPGVIGAGISSRGIIKVELDPGADNKQSVMNHLLTEVFHIKSEHPLSDGN
jgi:copper chaperone CopZ